LARLFVPDFYCSASDLVSQLAAARAELATLQERYDALRADRDRLARTLAENMKKWRRFKQWIFTTKVKVPSKPKHVGMRACSSSSTPASQQQSAVKMLETPMTPMSLSLPFFVSDTLVTVLLTLSRTSVNPHRCKTLPNQTRKSTEKSSLAEHVHP
jgi:hypothetical protein